LVKRSLIGVKISYLFVPLAVVPLCELYLLIEIGSVIGGFWTIGLSLATAALGLALVRWQGLGLVKDIRNAVSRGEIPALTLLEGAGLLLGGLLLFLPGFLTDFVGFAFLIPALRRWLATVVINRIKQASFTPERRPGRVVEGRSQRLDR
jgi:UPF0716 protein FxsA